MQRVPEGRRGLVVRSFQRRLGGEYQSLPEWTRDRIWAVAKSDVP